MNHELTAIPELNAIETTVATLSLEVQAATSAFAFDVEVLDAAAVSDREANRMHCLAEQCDATIATVARLQRRFQQPAAVGFDDDRLHAVRRYLSTTKRDLRESVGVMRLIACACKPTNRASIGTA